MDIIVKEVMGANPVTYEFLRGGCFINILPIKIEDSENLYRYKQAFVETTDMDAIIKYEALLRKQVYGTITRRQARLQLHKMGLLKTVEDKIAENEIYEIEWTSANTIEIDSPLISIVAEELGLSAKDVDDIFLAACKL